MRIQISLILIFVFVINSYSAPLIFKATKEVNSDVLVELASFDATKYKQVRIGIKFVAGSNNNSPAQSLLRRLTEDRDGLSKKLETLRSTLSENHSDVIGTRRDLDRANSLLSDATREGERGLKIETLGVEDDDEFWLIETYSYKHNNTSISRIIDNPPSRIRIKVSGYGIFKLYVWASQ